MSELLLPTKLYIPPKRPSLVPRNRLIDRLNPCIGGNVTIVAAPAGFGKTTLVVDWITQLENKRTPFSSDTACWLSLDENDNPFPRFFSYFIAAVQTTYPAFAEVLLSGLHMSSAPNDERLLSALLHELTVLHQPLLLVLDDYHTIHNPAIHKAISRLIDYMPPTMHLVITSREAPPLPLSRWRVRARLTEIQAKDLRFTEAETAVFFHQTINLPLNESAVTTLETRTEGWVAGLQLAAVSLRNAADAQSFIENFSGSNRHVADYLLEEVFRRQPPHIQAFLLQTAILNRFCAALCEAVVAFNEQGSQTENDFNPTSGIQTILSFIDKTHLFIIPLDPHRRWYRYHHLFSQLLRDRLKWMYGQPQIEKLHQRASRWFAAEGFREEAVYHAAQGQAWDEAARLLADTPVGSLWGQEGTTLLKRWGPQLPDNALAQYPLTRILLAAAHLFTGDIDQFNQMLELCAGIENIRGEYALFKSIQHRSEGNFRQALRLAQEAGEILSDDQTPLQVVALMQIAGNLLQLGDLAMADRMLTRSRKLVAANLEENLDIHLQIIQMQGDAAIMRADLKRAFHLYREGVSLAEQSKTGRSPRVGFMYAGLGKVHYEWNQLTEASAAYAQARQWAERSGIFDILMHTLAGEIRLLAVQGTAVDVDTPLEKYSRLGRQGEYQHMTHLTESVVAAIQLRLGRLEPAVNWANRSGFLVTDRPVFAQSFFYQTLAAVRLAEYEATHSREALPDLLELLAHLFQQAAAAHALRNMIIFLILQAMAFDLLDDAVTAGKTLQKAVDFAAPGKLVRVFLDAGPAPAPLLALCEGEHVRLLRKAVQQEIGASVQKTAVSPPLDLTPREFEVLLEIIAGLSNREIEEKLVISRNTVRTHIKNLYGKLDVTSRTQAIKKARDLHII